MAYLIINPNSTAGMTEAMLEVARAGGTTTGPLASSPFWTGLQQALDQLEEVLPLHPDMVLLDNFALADVLTAVHRRDARSPSTALEASGGLTLDQADEYGTSGVDYIAVGALTHSVRVLDIGLDFS